VVQQINPMQKNYLIGGVVVVLILGGLFLFNSDSKPKESTTGNTLTPASSFSHSHGIAVDTTDATKVYIATHEGLYLLQNDKDLPGFVTTGSSFYVWQY